VLIDYDDKVNSWYTTEPTPLEYSLGPYRSKPAHGIDIDSSEGELADTEDPTDKGKQTTPTPQPFAPYIMTSVQAQATTMAPTGLTVQTIPLGGGGAVEVAVAVVEAAAAVAEEEAEEESPQEVVEPQQAHLPSQEN